MPTITNAVIPKARGIFARRLSAAEYEELMRRRTVTEVAAVLRRHPYFQKSLASLSPTEPHRGQIEELLEMDIFHKYRSLAHYDSVKDGFSSYYLTRVEIQQILRAFHFISIGVAGAGISSVPSYLVGETRLDLFALAQARSYDDVLRLLEHTPYYKVLRDYQKTDPLLRQFPKLEHALLVLLYDSIFLLIEKFFSGQEKVAVQSLFLQEAEIYNLELMFRIKTFFPRVYTPEDVRELLLPYHHKVPGRLIEPMLHAASPEALIALYRSAGAVQYDGPIDMDALVAAGGRQLRRYAFHLLHLTSSPAAALAAFLTLARLERDNVINVVEGVRYGLPPEKIRAVLWY